MFIKLSLHSLHNRILKNTFQYLTAPQIAASKNILKLNQLLSITVEIIAEHYDIYGGRSDCTAVVLDWLVLVRWTFELTTKCIVSVLILTVVAVLPALCDCSSWSLNKITAVIRCCQEDHVWFFTNKSFCLQCCHYKRLYCREVKPLRDLV